MSAYARPTSLDEALELLAGEGAAPLGGGTDLAGQVDRGIRVPGLLVDLQDVGLDTIEPRQTVSRSAPRSPSATLQPPRARGLRRGRHGRRERRLTAVTGGRHRGWQPLPAHPLLVLPRARAHLLARRWGHLLRTARRPSQAQPPAG